MEDSQAELIVDRFLENVQRVTIDYLNMFVDDEDPAHIVHEALYNVVIPFGIDWAEWDYIRHTLEFGVPIGLAYENDVARAVTTCMARIHQLDLVSQVIEYDTAVRMIQKHFRRAYYVPEYSMCRERLIREAQELVAVH
jgi:hypothetical protein